MITYSSNEWVVEPANVTIISCVTSINIANYARNQCLKPDCTGGSTGNFYYENQTNTQQRLANKPVLINRTGMTGDIKLIPGFNCSIQQKNGVFSIEPVKGGGACLTEPYCGGSKIPFNDEEATQLASGNSLDGCVLCNQTLKAINGVSGTTINIQGGPGVSVVPENEHTLLIKLETQQFENGCEMTQEDNTTA